MEASDTTQENGTPPEGGSEFNIEQAFGGLVEQIEGTRGELRALQEQVAQPPAPVQEPEPEDDPLSLDWLNEPEAAVLPPEQITGRMVEQFREAARREAEQMVGPIAQRFEQSERRREIGALLDEIPALQDHDTARAVIEQTRAVAAEQYPHDPALAERVAQSPGMWRLVYLAASAATDARNQGPNPDPAHVEGGGAAPQLSEAEVGDRIVAASGGARALPFT